MLILFCVWQCHSMWERLWILLAYLIHMHMCECVGVCVPTVCGGHWVPSACGGVCSPVCWRSESAHWPLKLLQTFPPLCQWYGYYSGYYTEWKAGGRKVREQQEKRDVKRGWEEGVGGFVYREKHRQFILISISASVAVFLCLTRVWLPDVTSLLR